MLFQVKFHPMMSKKTFPYFILAFASVGAMIFALVFLWSMDADSPTVKDQAVSTLQLGIPSGIALIVLIWFGAGIDALLSRIQKRSARILASLGVYLILPGTLCIGLPALIIIVFFQSALPADEASRGFGTGLFLTLAAIPALMGFFFVYIGAGVNAASRHIAKRIWRDVETQKSPPDLNA